MSDSSAIGCQGLVRQFEEGGQILRILDGVELQVQAGESLAIIGQSGSGKSTLLHLLAGLDRPSQGEVQLAGTPLSGLSDRARTALRNRALGFVYQFHHLLPEFSAAENVAMPLALRGESWSSALEQAAQVLSTVGLGERLSHRPAQLSGGERQRVAVARALVGKPACVLADEPTGNLDQDTGRQVFAELLRLQKEHGTALILVTHDRALAAQTDRCLELRAGRLQALSPAAA